MSSRIWLSRIKFSALSVLATLSTAAHGSQLPWEQSPLAQAGQNPPAWFQPTPALQQQHMIPQNAPQFAPSQPLMGPSAMMPAWDTNAQPSMLSGLQGGNATLTNTVSTTLTQLNDPSLLNGYAASPVVPGFIQSTGTLGEWNALPIYNGMGSLPSPAISSYLQQPEFLTNPAAANLLYAPQVNPAMFAPQTYFNNPEFHSAGSIEAKEAEN